MADYPMWAAIRSVKEGLSGRAGLAAYRSGGGRVQDSTWFRMVAEARDAVAARGPELGRPQNRRPLPSEMTIWTTRKAKGVLQQVEVFVKDRDTQMVQRIPFSVRNPTAISRQAAIDVALANISAEGTDGDRQQFLGAVHVGTYVMVPGE